ncbi:uncharacterized protein METZ01_LOCUS378413, partial [marine metagenome]
VTVAAGTYVENINFRGRNIKVVGADRETTIIDGNQNGSVVTINNNESSDAMLKYFTIQNGSAYGIPWVEGMEDDDARGGGIFIRYAEPTLSNLIIKENIAENGGGIASDDGFLSPILDSLYIFDNTANSIGGGIFISRSSPIMASMTLIDNISSNGGGIAIQNNSDGTVFNNSVVKNNTANVTGGGMVLKEIDNVETNDILIAGNEALQGGGIEIVNADGLELENLTIADNIALESIGGAIGSYSSSFSIVNSIIYENGPEAISFYTNGDPCSITASYSDIEGGQDSIGVNDNGTVTWG